MDFSLTAEQELFRDTLRNFLSDRYGFAARRAAARTPLAMRPEIWSAFAQELGILNLSFPERVGGLGADPIGVMIAMEEFGRALLIEPFLETVVICGSLLSQLGGSRANEALIRIGKGELRLAFASAEAHACPGHLDLRTTAKRGAKGWQINGAKSVVMGAPWASQLLVTARTTGRDGDREGVSLFLVDIAEQGVELRCYPTIDGRRAADVSFTDVHVPPDGLVGAEGQALEVVEHVFDIAIIASAAEAVGVVSILHEATVDYAKQRRQFGRPIAGFQVLQHRMVDMYMQTEMARSAMYLGVLKLPASAWERALAASAAKVTVSSACRFVGQNAIQLHGGMGMTDECAVSHYFKRATAIEYELGTVDFHLQRHARLSRVNRSAGVRTQA